mgnify:CR=1 FL=1
MAISLGIDASVRSTGITYLSPTECKTLNIRPKKILGGERLNYIASEFIAFLENIQAPSIVIMEGPSFYSTNKPYLMGEVYGLFKYLTYCKLNLDPVLPSPKELKKYMCSSGDATKKQMISKAIGLGCPVRQEDVCDSFAAALLGIDILKSTNSPGTRKSLEVISKYALT